MKEYPPALSPWRPCWRRHALVRRLPIIILAIRGVFTSFEPPVGQLHARAPPAPARCDCLTCHHDFVDGKNILDPADTERGKHVAPMRRRAT